MDPTSVALPADVSPPRSSPPVPAADTGRRLGPWPVAILGVPFDPVSSQDALVSIDRMIASGRPHYVVTANVDFLVQARRDVELRRILIEADLVLCDGTPLLWASRWFGSALPERVAGSDLAPRLLCSAAERGHRVFFLGAGPGVAAAAAARLQVEYPALQVVGHYSPPVAALLEMDHAAIVERIRAAAPDILLVSFGCPKQEKWIAMHYRTLGVPVCIGVGATLDFLAGRVRRAPGWMRRSGCEWLYRLWLEPRRLYRRYAMDACAFVPALFAQWWRLNRTRHSPPGPFVAPVWSDDCEPFDAGVDLTRSSLEQHDPFWRRVGDADRSCALDLSRVRRIDAAGVAILVKCRRALRQRGHDLILVGTSPPVRRALHTMRLEEFFTFAASVAEARQSLAACQHPVVLDNGAHSLAWTGEITALNADAVWQVTVEKIRAHAAADAAVIPIDLAGLQFIDSAAVGLMLRLKQWARTLPVEILFTHPRPNVRNVLRIARVDQQLLEGAQ